MRKLLGALLLAVAAACNDSTGPGSGTLSGSYQLRTANGVAVPGIASQDVSGVYEVLRGRIVLRTGEALVEAEPPSVSASAAWRSSSPSLPAVRSLASRRCSSVFCTALTNSSTGLVSYSLTWIDPNTLAYAEPELSLIYAK